MRDSAGTLWFVSLDPTGFNESASGALLVANKLFWALGYYQVENFLASFTPEQLTLAPNARIRVESGQVRPMRRQDLDAVLARAAREPDGTLSRDCRPGVARYADRRVRVPRHPSRRSERHRPARASPRAARLEGVRRLDQPRRHEGRQHARHHRARPGRDGRSCATTCRTSAPPSAPGPTDRATSTKAGNRCSTRRGSCCGCSRSACTCGPGSGSTIRKSRRDRPIRGPVPSTLATGRRGCVPAAIRHARADDEFWAARRVMAFTDEMIAAAVRTGAYSDSAGRGLSHRGADRPARRDRAGLPAGDHAAGRLRLRPRHRRVVRQRRRARQGRRGAGRRLPGAVAAGGQRHRDRHADWRRGARRRAAGAGARRGCPRAKAPCSR